MPHPPPERSLLPETPEVKSAAAVKLSGRDGVVPSCSSQNPFSIFPFSRPPDLSTRRLYRVLRFPVIIMSPFLEKFEAPEGGYKFINGRGEEQDADEYIRVQELKLAEEANERMRQQEQNPLFGPRSSSPPADRDDGGSS